MQVSRSGYYQWLKREPSKREISRAKVIDLVEKVHAEHKTHGYRWTAAYIRHNYGFTCSDNYIYKCFRYLEIRSETKHRYHSRAGRIRDKCPNLIYSTWETVDRPRQVIVSDMTLFKLPFSRSYEVTFYFDVFTKEILTFQVAKERGSRDQYLDGLKAVRELLGDSTQPVILHTDQGSVYSSKAYEELIRDTVITHSMSRAGKPTDNPVNESLNGWIKEEMIFDFNINEYYTFERFHSALYHYVEYYNRKRPCYAIGYDTPENYRNRYYAGELPQRDTFSNRILTEEPKFIQKRRKQDVSGTVSVFENENDEKRS